MSLLSILLKPLSIRRRILSDLRYNYFHEFEHSIPLGNGYWAELLENDAYDSFSEIFIIQEYADFLPEEPLIRILDIGAHYGYFSLWVQSKFPDTEIYSVMVEPSPRCARSLQKLIRQKHIRNRYTYLQRVVGNPQEKHSNFVDRPYMAGSCFSSIEDHESIQLPILLEGEILTELEPPYDLIKCDIEGSELEFIEHYPILLKNTKYILLEWHSWHSGGGGYPQLKKRLIDYHFEIVKSSQPIPAIGREGEVGYLLARNIKLVT